MNKIILLIIALLIIPSTFALQHDLIGTSMEPLLFEGDIIHIKKLNYNYDVGDVVVFQFNETLSICHVIVKIQNNIYTTWGINNPWFMEETFTEEQIIGKVDRVRRGHRLKSMSYLIDKWLEAERSEVTK